MHDKYRFLTLGKEPFFLPFNIPSLHSTWKMGRFPAWAPHQKKKKNGAFFRKTTQLFQRHSSGTQAQGASPAQRSFNVENGAFPSLGSSPKKKKNGAFFRKTTQRFQRYSAVLKPREQGASPAQGASPTRAAQSREQAPPRAGSKPTQRDQAQPRKQAQLFQRYSSPISYQVASPPRGLESPRPPQGSNRPGPRRELESEFDRA